MALSNIGGSYSAPPSSSDAATRAHLSDRRRIARVLHDRILNLVAGAALRLRVSIQIADEPLEVRSEHLEIAEQTIQQVQRELRALIESLRNDARAATVPVPTLAQRLSDLRNTIGSAWLVSMDVRVTGSAEPLRHDVVEHTIDIVQEAAINAVRHGHASQIAVDVDLGLAAISIVVVDNGRGFDMFGRYDLAALANLNAGPAMVRERVASLDGSLVLFSTPEGSRLEIEYTKHPRH